MVNQSVQQHWQHPLHVQWQSVSEGNTQAQVQYRMGISTGFVQLRGKADDALFMQAVTEVLGASLPLKAKETVYTEQAAILWVSPDEWMLVCATEAKAALLQALQAALRGVFAQVVDNSGGMMLLQIQGVHASTVLRHLSPYNIEALGVDQSVATLLKRTNVLIVRVSEQDYAVVIRRSFADYMWRVLQKAATPYGFAVHKQWQFAPTPWQNYAA